MVASFEGQMETQGIPVAYTKIYSDLLFAGCHNWNSELDLTGRNEKIARLKLGSLNLVP